MPLYFEIGPSPRRVVRLDRRDADPQTGIRYAPVQQEMDSEQLSRHELADRLRHHKNVIKRRMKGIGAADGALGAPATDRERAKWEQEVAGHQAKIPRTEVLLADAEQRITMLQAVLDGRQADDRLGPVPEWFRLRQQAQAEPLPDTEPTDEQAVALEWAESDEGQQDARVAEIARQLDHFGVPTSLGRRQVRELLADRAPDLRVGDAPLSAAIKYRRSA